MADPGDPGGRSGGSRGWMNRHERVPSDSAHGIAKANSGTSERRRGDLVAAQVPGVQGPATTRDPLLKGWAARLEPEGIARGPFTCVLAPRLAAAASKRQADARAGWRKRHAERHDQALPARAAARCTLHASRSRSRARPTGPPARPGARRPRASAPPPHPSCGVPEEGPASDLPSTRADGHHIDTRLTRVSRERDTRRPWRTSF
jgi:hypothetical protein